MSDEITLSNRERRLNGYALMRYSELPKQLRRNIEKETNMGSIERAVALVESKRMKQAVRRLHNNNLI